MCRPFTASLVVALCLAAVGRPVIAQEAEPLVVLASAQEGEHVKARVFLEAAKLAPGQATKFAVVLDIAPGWHVNANEKGAKFQIPTAVAVKSQLGTTLTAIKYPDGETETIPGLDQPLKIYKRRAIIYGTVTAPESTAGQTEAVAFGVRFQACSESGECLPPQIEKLTGRVAVAGPGEAVKKVNTALFKPLAAAERAGGS